MATKNLSEYNFDAVPDASEMRFGIVVAEWNFEITGGMLNGARETLIKHGAKEENIKEISVPGAFELPKGATWMADRGLNGERYDAIILIGDVIQGETKHFDYVCKGVTDGIVGLNFKYPEIPFIFCVLTDTTKEQSIARSGGKLGNKGDEAAVAAIKMAALEKELQ